MLPLLRDDLTTLCASRTGTGRSLQYVTLLKKINRFLLGPSFDHGRRSREETPSKALQLREHIALKEKLGKPSVAVDRSGVRDFCGWQRKSSLA